MSQKIKEVETVRTSCEQQCVGCHLDWLCGESVPKNLYMDEKAAEWARQEANKNEEQKAKEAQEAADYIAACDSPQMP